MTQINKILQGIWIGNWGNRKNVKIIFTNIVEHKFHGYYELNQEQQHFIGNYTKIDNILKLSFDPPMSKNSGGFLDLKDMALKLFCDSKVGNYIKED